MHASHVVVDEHDGYTFWAGADGQMFTAETAAAFAGQRNAEMKPEHALFKVFGLMPAQWLSATWPKPAEEATR